MKCYNSFLFGFVLDERDLVFTGGGASSTGCGSREGGHNGGKDNVGCLGSVDGCVQAPFAVILHQRHRLTVVRVQAGAQCRLVVIAAPHQWFTRHLGEERTEVVLPFFFAFLLSLYFCC